ncbi:hypothetical protein ALO65_200127 [Pseudomonas syringae pv. papulans]|nr:hypothetical protein ALO65_200127 [Pseudomonas syringae pv. papulans]
MLLSQTAQRIIFILDRAPQAGGRFGNVAVSVVTISRLPVTDLLLGQLIILVIGSRQQDTVAQGQRINWAEWLVGNVTCQRRCLVANGQFDARDLCRAIAGEGQVDIRWIANLHQITGGVITVIQCFVIVTAVDAHRAVLPDQIALGVVGIRQNTSAVL